MLMVASLHSIVSLIIESGTAQCLPATATTREGTIARLVGTIILKRVPIPALVETSILPDSAVIAVLTTSIPTPRPETSVTVCAVVIPGRNISSSASFSLNSLPICINPRSLAESTNERLSIPLPSSSISMAT